MEDWRDWKIKETGKNIFCFACVSAFQNVSLDVVKVVVGGCRWLKNFFEVVVGGFRPFHVLVTTIF